MTENSAERHEVTIILHPIATDGLPDMDALVGRVAFIFDGKIISGWPVEWSEGEWLWTPNDDVGRADLFASVTHWVEFPEPVWDLVK